MSYNGTSLESLGVRTSPPREQCNLTETSYTEVVEQPTLIESLTTVESVEQTVDMSRKLTTRWDIWLYTIFYVIIILFGILFLVNINNSSFYQRLNYPNWAPSVWILMVVWAFTFIISLGGLFLLLSHTMLSFFMLMLLLNLVLLMTFIIIMWFAGLIILACVILILAIIYSIFVTVVMSRYTVIGACLQIPYMLFLVLLTIIAFQLSYDNDSNPNQIRTGRIINEIINQISSNNQ